MSEFDLEPTKISVPKDTMAGLRMAGNFYHVYDVVLRGVQPGVLMNFLDPDVLAPAPEPVVSASEVGGGGRKGRKPKAPAAPVQVPESSPEVEGDEEHVSNGATFNNFECPNVQFVQRPGLPEWARNPKKLWKQAVKVGYITHDGILACPTANLHGIIGDAAASFPRKTGLSRAAGAGIFIESDRDDDYIPFLRPDTGEPYQLKENTPIRVLTRAYQISRNPDICVLIVPTSSSRGKKILTARIQLPCWEELDAATGKTISHGWTLKFRVRYDAAIISKDDADSFIRDCIWMYSGTYIGCMNWRPGAPKRPGPYGRYEVQKHEIMKKIK